MWTGLDEALVGGRSEVLVRLEDWNQDTRHLKQCAH